MALGRLGELPVAIRGIMAVEDRTAALTEFRRHSRCGDTQKTSKQLT